MREIQREFGERDGVVLIGHRNERAIRRRYPRHLPCSTSIVAFHTGELVLERLGSLDAEVIEAVANRHGLTLTIGDGAHERVPVRASRRPTLRAAYGPTSSRSGSVCFSADSTGRVFARRRRGPLTFISWARK
jgi:hypothetical protein